MTAQDPTIEEDVRDFVISLKRGSIPIEEILLVRLILGIKDHHVCRLTWIDPNWVTSQQVKRFIAAKLCSMQFRCELRLVESVIERRLNCRPRPTASHLRDVCLIVRNRWLDKRFNFVIRQLRKVQGCDAKLLKDFKGMHIAMKECPVPEIPDLISE